jgi:hypothetical protein
VSNTSTRLDTYQDPAGTVLNSWPVPLDVNGSANIYLTAGSLYRFVVQYATGVTLYDVSSIAAPNSQYATTAALAALTAFEVAVPSPPISTQPYYTSSGLTQISTANATNNWILNVTYASAVSLNSTLAVGKFIEINFCVANGATPFFQTALQIDGVAVTPQWDGGAAPTSGDANSTDVYTYKILKTANAVYSVFASVKQFQ